MPRQTGRLQGLFIQFMLVPQHHLREDAVRAAGLVARL